MLSLGFSTQWLPRRPAIGSRVEGDVILTHKNRLTLAYVLSGLLAVLLVISSVTGLLYGGYDLYDSYLATHLLYTSVDTDVFQRSRRTGF